MVSPVKKVVKVNANVAKKPKGHPVLEYEQRMIAAEIAKDTLRLCELAEEDPYGHAEIYEASLQKNRDAYEAITNIIAKYPSTNDQYYSYPTYEPLDEYYRNYTDRLLTIFFQDIEQYYNGMSNLLLSTDTVLFRPVSNKVAKSITYWYGAEHVVKEFLTKEQLNELYRLENPTVADIRAIQQKYKYFTEALVNCWAIQQAVKKL